MNADEIRLREQRLQADGLGPLVAQAKYNRLLVIEEETGWRVGTPGKRM